MYPLWPSAPWTRTRGKALSMSLEAMDLLDLTAVWQANIVHPKMILVVVVIRGELA